MSTLATLRDKVANRLNVALAGSVTAAGVDTLNAFTDNQNVEAQDILAGGWALFTSGTNAGVARQIAGNQDGEISLRNPLPAAAVVADVYTIYRRFSPTQIRDGINFAIRNVLPYLYVNSETDVAEDPLTMEYSYPAGLIELRQLRRRTNPGQTPPAYQDLRGEYWEDLGGKVRIRYRPATGQLLQFLGYAAFPELSVDTDVTTLPDELVIAGAGQNLYENLVVGESGSSSGFFEKQADKWNKYYEQLKLRYAMPAIPWELHPPGHRIIRGWSSSLGPVIGGVST